MTPKLTHAAVMRAAANASDMMTNGLASIRWLPRNEIDLTRKDDLMRQVLCGAVCLNALASLGFDFAYDRLAVFRSELFRLGIAQKLECFNGQTAESALRSDP